MPAVPTCKALIVRDDLTCGTCGRAVAQYPARDGGEIIWQHRRGARQGTVFALRAEIGTLTALLTAATAQGRRDAERIAQLEDLLEGAGYAQLTRIEGKLDELLKRGPEWKPNHRRIADGGTPVRAQRRERKRQVAVPIEPIRPSVARIA